MSATTTTPPTSRTFFTDLLSTLPNPSSPETPGIDSRQALGLNTAQKPILLTLHAIFPRLLLPALDLLDRNLITRLVLDKSVNDTLKNTGGVEPSLSRDGLKIPSEKQRVVYYVKSNAHNSKSSRYGRHADALETNYEVRIQAWNCSCAAFAFAAFSGAAAWAPDYPSYDDHVGYGHREEDEEMLDAPENDEEAGRTRDGKLQWGGLMQGQGEVPLCKHLLACVLSERWDVAGSMVEGRNIGREEMAGWAAGWGG